MAALYMGVSITTFRQRVRSRVYPQPVREGGRNLWGRRQLDGYVDAQFNISKSAKNDPEDQSWADFN
ncbi:hypothetical protein [Sphingosinicella sp. LY1275]|uniref:hypothetical protein n=1 Tax=Sphingosinicella sp. LY1275 TaxID=3095379 RepID=UPI002ADEEE1B|nr:hypothetical protein [Sphingosinicella sp. LY1275]MEA1015575.1 hypothetical protein [Sphingosinicella sp. LY1275]